jgi:hypothetical protein
MKDPPVIQGNPYFHAGEFFVESTSILIVYSAWDFVFLKNVLKTIMKDDFRGQLSSSECKPKFEAGIFFGDPHPSPVKSPVVDEDKKAGSRLPAFSFDPVVVRLITVRLPRPLARAQIARH